jgi:dTDP-glucose pyrophosphorylase
MMRVEQALIAIGGNASRLKAGGIEVASTKPFLSVAEKPLLFWCLSSLCAAGIKKVVLVGNHEVDLRQAESVIDSLSHDFQEVEYFKDKGLGAHGLPYHAQHLLDDEFFFVCGHGISKPSHYKQMDEKKTGAI